MSILTLMNALGDCGLEPKLEVTKCDDKDVQKVISKAENGYVDFYFDMDGKFIKVVERLIEEPFKKKTRIIGVVKNADSTD